MIPPFEDVAGYPHGLLPEGMHEANDEEFQRLLVEAFPASRTRKAIAAQYFEFRSESARLGIRGELWVDGSFVEAKIDPNDIDVLPVLDANQLNELPSGARVFIENVMMPRPPDRRRYRLIDSRVLTRVSSDDPRYSHFLRDCNRWIREWGRTKPQTGADGVSNGIPKGFVVQPFGENPEPTGGSS